MIDIAKFAEELFFQLVFRQFACVPRLRLSTAIDIKRCVRHALDTPEALWVPSDGNKDGIAEGIALLLKQKAEMIDEYFGIQIESGCLVGLPELLMGYRPCVEAIPLFLIRLATGVDWSTERDCFLGIAHELASFYTQLPFYSADSVNREQWSAPIVHHWIPSIRALLMPPQTLTEHPNIVQLSTLPELYKIFGRSG